MKYRYRKLRGLHTSATIFLSAVISINGKKYVNLELYYNITLKSQELFSFYLFNWTAVPTVKC